MGPDGSESGCSLSCQVSSSKLDVSLLSAIELTGAGSKTFSFATSSLVKTSGSTTDGCSITAACVSSGSVATSA